ncbi:MAG: hypothetical protein JW863_01585 [Chitinispirillaceae bacterium]|nr:hypothetical protein [Chitinispirillaceae bacterium]
MNYENNFYRELAGTPELPADIFPAIERTIRKRSAFRRSLYVIAASIPIAIAAVTLSINQPSRYNNVQPEVASELQIIHDYLNSSDLDSDLKLYAVVEGY